MSNLFSTIPSNAPSRNTFDLSHDVKLSCKMGDLIPIGAIETNPGDIFNISSDAFIRFAPLIAPVMHKFNCTVHHFFVPNRLTWPNWEDFITGKTTGGLPQILVEDTLTTEQQRFLDYFGIPPISESWSSTNPVAINALPLMAYQKIYNDWYRDQNLITELNTELADGVQAVGIMATMRKRAWMHDYFTSALPAPQKGAAVNMPYGDVVLKTGNQSANDPMFRETTTQLPAAGALAQNGLNDITVGGLNEYMYDPDGTLTTATNTVAEFRASIRLQEFLEKLMRGGQRYIEVIRNFFGEVSSDSRLQRPEYIGGLKQAVSISEVLNTSGAFNPADPTEAGSPAQGAMAGHGVSLGLGENSSFKCEEHGFIITILNIQPITAYQQGIHRSWLRNDPYDYYWPQFAHIGEQAIQIDEIFAYEPDPAETFGYQSRYAELKSIPSRVAGDFRTTLNHWTAARIFNTKPVLNQEFIEVHQNAPQRIFAVQDGTDYLWCQIAHRIIKSSKMAVYGEPTI